MRDRRSLWRAVRPWCSADRLGKRLYIRAELTARGISYGDVPKAHEGRRIVIELDPAECDRLIASLQAMRAEL